MGDILIKLVILLVTIILIFASLLVTFPRTNISVMIRSSLEDEISKQKAEIVYLQRNCPKFGTENLFLPDLSKFDKELLASDSHKLMFFLETSGRPHLTIRQACALESAEASSGRLVLLLMNSDILDVCDSKLAPVLSLPGLLFAHLNHSLLVQETPLLRIWEDGRINKSCCSMIHNSDLLRMAVTYRYGGWYSDMDTITVRKSDHLQNVVASSGDFVANGNLIFSPKNGFLHLLMKRSEKKFTGQGWNSIGPVLLTESILDLCHVGRQTGKPIIGHHKSCWNLTVLDHDAFYPLKANQRHLLFEDQNEKHWAKQFKKSYSVHFFGQITSGRGWHTGNYTAYDYLGRKFCPRTYAVQENMDLWA